MQQGIGQETNIGDICRHLNDALMLNHFCIQRMFKKSFTCNKAIKEHPHIVVTNIFEKLSFLGLLNGLVADPEYRIAKIVDYDGITTGFQVVKISDLNKGEEV